MAKLPPNLQPKPNLLDKVISYVSPETARKRLYHRQMLALNGYSGASKSSRSLKAWKTTNANADSIISDDIDELRERSSDLIRNSPLASGAINTNVTSVIGTGLKVKPTINRAYLGLSEDEADQWEASARFEFNSLCDELDFNNQLTFCELQELVFRSQLEKGDCFTLLTSTERKVPYTLALQLIEAERVCNKDDVTDTPTLMMGIEKDAQGRPINCHIKTTHPGDTRNYNREWQVIPFEDNGRVNILHHSRPLRIGETRSVPYLAPVIESLKQLGRYSEAELMAAVIGGMYTVFIKAETDLELDKLEGEDNVSSSSTDDYELGNGTVVGLGENESIDVANPGRPNVAFDPFVLAILRQVGVSLELPFEILIKHFTSSFSASQAALLEAWRYFKGRRNWLAHSFCQPVYAAVIDEAVATGRLSAPGYFNDPFIRYAYLGTTWVGDARGNIDNRKAAEGDKLWIDMGVKTREEVTIETTGRDWEVNHKQSVKENEARTSAGLEPTNPASSVVRVENED